MNQEETYTTRIFWQHENNHTLVVDCSDPRLTEARNEFLMDHCNVSRYDSLIVPGGPVVLTFANPSCYVEHERVRMLHDLHTFKRIIGITHFDCGFYKHHYPQTLAPHIYTHQVADLHNFKTTMSTLALGAKVEIYYVGPNPNNLTEYKKIS